MAMPGRLEQIAAGLGNDAVVYPFFMAKGWFVTQALPARFEGRSLSIADPLGLDSRLAEVGARALSAQAARQGWNVCNCSILIAAHGSARGTKAADAAYGFVDTLKRLLPGTTCLVGFVEQTPTIAQEAAVLGQKSLCLPFFALSGEHVQKDIPLALKQAGYGGVLMPVLGQDADIPDLIAAALMRSLPERTPA